MRKLNKKAGITMDCEKKERDFQESLMCGKIWVEEQPLKFTDRSDKQIVNDTPVDSIENLPSSVSNLLDQIQYEKKGLLTCHDNRVPANEIWVKIGPSWLVVLYITLLV